ncbi:MAG: hypothetical protein BM562_07025 [Alphaproteobacteria bacterium MedPE-SWcel]|nr:MAG: hypothetical protein BM562_07025 [Alphaproteobacteria bacterium MedPE-SWcel]
MSIRILLSSGIFWALLAAALYTLSAATSKILVEDFHVLQILFFRQIVVLLSTLRSIVGNFPHSLYTQRPGLHALRLAGAFLALSCGIWAVAVLPFATAVTLSFSQVFFVALLARLFLGEVVSRRTFTAIGLGFFGVLIVMRPSSEGLSSLYALVPLLSGFGGAMAVISVRRLSQTESTATLLLYQSIFVGLLSGLPLIFLWQTPTLQQLPLLLAVGFIATLGQWAGIHALRLVEAHIVGVFEYVKLVYAETLGVLVFDEHSDRQTLIGASIIVVAAFYAMRLRARANGFGPPFSGGTAPRVTASTARDTGKPGSG